MKAATNSRAQGSVRRPQILRRAAELFQRHGYHATSMDQVAAALGLNKATIYHHFPGGKSDLLYEINAAALDDLLSRADGQEPVADPVTLLRQVIQAMIDVQVAKPDDVIVYYEEGRWLKQLLPDGQYREVRAKEAAFRRRVQSIVEAGVQRGVFSRHDPSLVTFSLITLVGASYRRLRGSDERDPEDLAANYVELVLTGLLERPSESPSVKP